MNTLLLFLLHSFMGNYSNLTWYDFQLFKFCIWTCRKCESQCNSFPFSSHYSVEILTIHDARTSGVSMSSSLFQVWSDDTVGASKSFHQVNQCQVISAYEQELLKAQLLEGEWGEWAFVFGKPPQSSTESLIYHHYSLAMLILHNWWRKGISGQL